MSRPCACDRCCTQSGCEYDLSQCRLCWLWHHDAHYQAIWSGGRRVGVEAFGVTAVEPGKWPLLARVVARLRKPQDRGLGDTLQRAAARFGGEWYKKVYKRLTGSDCGCGGRQERLNVMYPYGDTKSPVIAHPEAPTS